MIIYEMYIALCLKSFVYISQTQGRCFEIECGLDLFKLISL